MKAPIFLCLPDLVRGIPIRLEILALKAEMPKKRLQENPPKFIKYSLIFMAIYHIANLICIKITI